MSLLPRRFAFQALCLALGAAAVFQIAMTGAGTAADPAVPEARQAEVEQLIDRYFRTWSSQDLIRYGQCFVPQAAIQLIDPAGRLVTMPLAPFLKSQQEAQRQAANPMTETAESVDVRFEAELARVVVRWKLLDGNRVEYGYDHFTLMRSEGKWRIANLIFYADKPTAKAPN
jgi:pyroglutamyl-peptidase